MKNAFIIAAFFISFEVCSQPVNLFPVKQNNKWGYIDLSGQIKISPQYEAAGHFENDGFAKIQENGKVGLIDSAGKVVVNPIYDNIRQINSMLFAIQTKKEWEIITIGGEKFSNVKFDDFKTVKGGFIFFKKNSKYGVIDRNGKLVYSPRFDSLYFDRYNFLSAVNNDLLGLYDINGNEILPCKYDGISIQDNDRIYFSDKRLWGLVNDKGKILVEPEWDEITWINGSLFKLRCEKLFTVFNVNSGKTICDPSEINFTYFSDDYVMTHKNNLVGLMDLRGKEIIKPIYDDIAAGTKNCVIVKKDKRCGLADLNGKELIAPQFEFILSFDNHVAMTINNRLSGLINDKGIIIEDTRNESLSIYQNVVKARNNGTLKIIELNSEGNLADATNYDNAKTIHVGSRDLSQFQPAYINRNIPVQKGGWFYSGIDRKYGLKNSEGKIVIWPIYDKIKTYDKCGLTRTEITNVQTEFHVGNATFKVFSKYGIVDHINYKVIAPATYLDIKIDAVSDYASTLASCVSENGQPGFLSCEKYNAFYPRSFVDTISKGVLRYNVMGKLIIENSGTSDEEITSLKNYMNSFSARWEPADFQTKKMVEDDDKVIRCVDGAWGIYYNDRIVVRPFFQFIKYCDRNYMVAKYKDKWGISEVGGREITPSIYDNIEITSVGNEIYFRVFTKNSKYGFVNEDGTMKVEALYDEVEPVMNGFARVKKDSAWGFIDMNGNEIGKIKYSQVKDFSDGYAAVRLGKKWGYINTEGDETILFQFVNAENFSDGLAAVKLKSKWGYINQQGEFVIASAFVKARPFNDGLAWASSSGNLGLIDKSGNWIVKPKFSTAENFDGNGLSVVSKNWKYGLLSKQGEIISSLKFEQILPFTANGLALVKLKGRIGFIDTTGRIKIKPEYRRGFSFSEGYAVVLSDSGYGLINEMGEFTLLNSLSKIFSFENNLASVFSKKRKAGVMDLDKEINLFDKVNLICNYSFGKAVAVNSNGQYYIDQWGNFLFNEYFQVAKSFDGDKAIVKVDDHWGIINDKGIFIVSPKYDDIKNYSGGYAAFRMDSFVGIVDTRGKMILDPEFDYVQYCGNSLFRVERNNKIGYIDKSGKWLWEMQM